MAAKQDAEAQAPGSIPGIGQAGRERSVRWVYIWLLFISLLTVPWMAWSLNRLDAHQTDLTGNAEGDVSPAWSRDGTHIAFVSYRDGNAEIYVMNADGSSQMNLTGNTARDHAPAWSPDGRHIAFVSDRDGNGEIYVMNVDGSDVIRLSHAASTYEAPAWSPDGSRIAFVSYYRDGTSEIYVMNADGSGQTTLTRSAAWDHAPAWSPDGSRIAFVSYRDGQLGIYVMNSDGSDVSHLTHNSWPYEAPAWSPDATRIAFVSESDGPYGIYVMNADGSGQTNLTPTATYADYPAWSPDGTRIVFLCGPNAEMCVMNADGSGQMNLGHYQTIEAPAWSPDGASIAFSWFHGRQAICVVQSDGTNVRNLSAGGTRATEAATPAPIPLAEYVAAVSWPGLVQVVLLIPLRSPYRYVRRHGQQAFLLAVAGVLSTVLLVGITRGALVGLWVVVNGGLWIFGSVWGLRQIRRGDCWLMRRRGEVSELPRPWAAPKVAEPTPTAPGPTLAPGVMPAGQDERAATVEALRLAFRTGSPEERQRALEALKALGEIEEF